MKNTFFSRLTPVALLMALASGTAVAQDKSDEIKVEITTEQDGEQRTFKKTYSSEEAMRKDPELREFLGPDAPMHFWVSPDKPPRPLRPMPGPRHFYFGFSDDDMDSFDRQFRVFMPDDSTMKAYAFKMKKFHEQMADIEIDIRQHMDSMRASGAFSFDEEVVWLDGDSLKERVTVQVDRARALRNDSWVWEEDRARKRVEISEEVGSQFGKMGQTKSSEKLELPDLEFLPNPSPHGKFRLRFTVPQEGELSIKLFDTKSNEVYTRFFSRYGGVYRESVDLTGQPAGDYLLEITSAGKRLVRKIEVE